LLPNSYLNITVIKTPLKKKKNKAIMVKTN